MTDRVPQKDDPSLGEPKYNDRTLFVIVGLAQGLTHAEIAGRLSIAPHTVTKFISRHRQLIGEGRNTIAQLMSLGAGPIEEVTPENFQEAISKRLGSALRAVDAALDRGDLDAARDVIYQCVGKPTNTLNVNHRGKVEQIHVIEDQETLRLMQDDMKKDAALTYRKNRLLEGETSSQVIDIEPV